MDDVAVNRSKLVTIVRKENFIPKIHPEECIEKCVDEDDGKDESEMNEGNALDRNIILNRRKDLVGGITKPFFAKIKPNLKNFEQFCFIDELSLRRTFEKVFSHHRRSSVKMKGERDRKSGTGAIVASTKIFSSLNAQAPPFCPQKAKDHSLEGSDISHDDAKLDSYVTAVTSSNPIEVSSSLPTPVKLAVSATSVRRGGNKRGYILNRRPPLSAECTGNASLSLSNDRLDSRLRLEEYVRATLNELDALRLNNFAYFRSDDQNTQLWSAESNEPDVRMTTVAAATCAPCISSNTSSVTYHTRTLPKSSCEPKSLVVPHLTCIIDRDPSGSKAGFAPLGAGVATTQHETRIGQLWLEQEQEQEREPELELEQRRTTLQNRADSSNVAAGCLVPPRLQRETYDEAAAASAQCRCISGQRCFCADCQGRWSAPSPVRNTRDSGDGRAFSRNENASKWLATGSGDGGLAQAGPNRAPQSVARSPSPYLPAAIATAAACDSSRVWPVLGTASQPIPPRFNASDQQQQHRRCETSDLARFSAPCAANTPGRVTIGDVSAAVGHRRDDIYGTPRTTRTPVAAPLPVLVPTQPAVAESTANSASTDAVLAPTELPYRGRNFSSGRPFATGGVSTSTPAARDHQSAAASERGRVSGDRDSNETDEAWARLVADSSPTRSRPCAWPLHSSSSAIFQHVGRVSPPDSGGVVSAAAAAAVQRDTRRTSTAALAAFRAAATPARQYTAAATSASGQLSSVGLADAVGHLASQPSPSRSSAPPIAVPRCCATRRSSSPAANPAQPQPENGRCTPVDPRFMPRCCVRPPAVSQRPANASARHTDARPLVSNSAADAVSTFRRDRGYELEPTEAALGRYGRSLISLRENAFYDATA